MNIEDNLIDLGFTILTLINGEKCIGTEDRFVMIFDKDSKLDRHFIENYPYKKKEFTITAFNEYNLRTQRFDRVYELPINEIFGNDVRFQIPKKLTPLRITSNTSNKVMYVSPGLDDDEYYKLDNDKRFKKLTGGDPNNRIDSNRGGG